VADIVSPETRSRMMSGIRASGTVPELVLRKGLHRRGLRFRLHDKRLPGKPDLVFPKHRATLFAHGCFWHAHDCSLFKWPSSREAFWREKISGNRARDERNEAGLKKSGWRVGRVWECALKGKGKLDPEQVLDICADWVRSQQPELDVRGHE